MFFDLWLAGLERLPDRRWAIHPPNRPGPVWGPAVHDPPIP